MSSSSPSSMRKPYRSRQAKHLRLRVEDRPLSESYFLGKLKDHQKIPFTRILKSPEASQTHLTLINSVIEETACQWFNDYCNTLHTVLETTKITGETIAPHFLSSLDIIIIGLAYMQKMLEILSCEPLPNDKLRRLVDAIKKGDFIPYFEDQSEQHKKQIIFQLFRDHFRKPEDITPHHIEKEVWSALIVTSQLLALPDDDHIQVCEKKLMDFSVEMADSEKQQCRSRNISFFNDDLIRFSHFEQISLKKPELFADKLILSMFHRFIKTAFHEIYQYDAANNQFLDFEEMLDQSRNISTHSIGDDSETSLPNRRYITPAGRIVVYLTDFPSPSSEQPSSQSTTPKEDPESTSGIPQNIEASSLGDCHTPKVSSLRIVVIINAWGFYWLLAPGKKNESIKLFRHPRTAENYMRTQPASFYLPVLAEQATYALQPEPTEITGPVRRQLQF